MNLLNCPKCGSELDSEMLYCQDCGANLNEVNRQGSEMIMEIPFEDPKVKETTTFWSYKQAKILLGISIISILLSLYSIFNIQKISKKVEETEKETQLVRDEVLANSKVVEVISDYQKYMDGRLMLTNMGINMSGGVVTDKAVVDKATFYPDFSEGSSEGDFYGIVDIRPQPSYSSKFLGQGNFDLTDRELRSMLEELVDNMISFGLADDDSKSLMSIEITANNYTVANYKDGKIVLAGE